MESKANAEVRKVYAMWKAANGFKSFDVERRLKVAARTWSRRQKDFGTMTLSEFRQFVRATQATPDEVWTMVTGRR